METYGVPDMSVEVFKTLELLRPFDIDVPLKRVGPASDGGYVFADIFAGQDLISFGISNDVRFEKALAMEGHRCYMYDHTIDVLPDTHSNFNFYRIGVSGAADETDDLLSIKSHLARLDLSEQLILKIDVEGAEWDVFSTIDDAELLRFDQIAGEFHWFLQLGDENFRSKVLASLKKLAQHFTIVNVHANNCRVLGFVNGFPIADVLELSFVRNDLVKRSANTRIFPRETDKANNVVIADHPLLFFPFLPTNTSQNEFDALITRIAQERQIS